MVGGAADVTDRAGNPGALLEWPVSGQTDAENSILAAGAGCGRIVVIHVDGRICPGLEPDRCGGGAAGTAEALDPVGELRQGGAVEETDVPEIVLHVHGALGDYHPGEEVGFEVGDGQLGEALPPLAAGIGKGHGRMDRRVDLVVVGVVGAGRGVAVGDRAGRKQREQVVGGLAGRTAGAAAENHAGFGDRAVGPGQICLGTVARDRRHGGRRHGAGRGIIRPVWCGSAVVGA